MPHSYSRRTWLDDARQDLHLALRSLRLRPGYAAFVIAVLALGIGANAAVFGILDRLFLSPPPHVRAAGEVVRLRFAADAGGDPYSMSSASYAAFADLEAAAVPGVRALAAISRGAVTLGRGADARPLSGARVSGSYFPLLGAAPERGRLLAPADDVPGAPAVAVVSHAFWQRELGGRPEALGTDLELDRRPTRIVGIAPAGFTGEGIEPVDVWTPLVPSLAVTSLDWRGEHGLRIVEIVARLAPDAPRQATAAALTHALRAADPDADVDVRLQALTAALGPDGVTSDARVALWLGGVALLVLAIALGNVATLGLLRGLRRERDTAVRAALGMSRGRLLRQELVESALLAALAATAGLGLSVFVAEMLRRTLLPGMAAPAAYFAPRVLLITLAAAALASLLAAWLPARQTWALALAQCLEERVSALRFRRSRLLMGVVLAQTAFATVLVVGAGLFVASLLRVRALDLGFTTVRTLLVELPDGARVGGARQDEFFRAALERVRNLPGVELAVPVDSLPFGAHTVPPISVPGLAEAPGEHTQLPFLNAADPDYFRLLGMTIRRGRGVLARDDAHAPLVAVVNETMARVVWPHEDALGKCIRVGFAPGEPPSPRASASLPCREVVGIVNDARRRSLRTEAIPIMQYYLPYPQVPAPPVPDVPTISGLLVRTAGDPGRAARDVQHALQSLGAADAVPYVVVRPYQDLIDPLSRSWRVGSRLLTMSGALALLLAAVGLYALLSTAVEARRREIGVRMALGARAAHVVAAVVSEAMALAVPGVLLGILAALAGGGLAEPLLFEVSGRDPWVLASAAAALLGATLVASALPARRAAALDPGVTLRGE